jgi:hypothetical protein
MSCAEPNPSAPAPPTDGEVEAFGLGAGIDWADPKSPLARYYCRLGDAVALLALGLFFVVFTHLVPVWHTDVWAHLRFGEYIVQNRRLPEHELFSGDYADQTAPYINYQWIPQVSGYLLFDLGSRCAAPDDDARLGGGALLLTAAHAAVLTARLALLWLAFRRLTGSSGWATAGAALVVGLSVFVHLFILRPQILGEFFFATVLLALSRPLLSMRALMGVPLSFALWANCHGSFAMGFMLLGVALVGRAIQAAAEGGRAWEVGARLSATWRDPQTRRLAMVIALSAAATCLNPHGPALWMYASRLAADPNIATMEEWKHLPIKSLAGYTFLAMTALLIPVLRWSPARLTPTQALLLLVFGLGSLYQARVLVWYVVIFTWVIVPHLQALGRRLAGATATGRRLRTAVAALAAEPPNLRWTIIGAVGFLVLVVLWSAPAWWAWGWSAPRGDKRVTIWTPYKAARRLRDAYSDADARLSPVVFASETMGDYLFWDLRDFRSAAGDPLRIFAYTHVHLLTPDHWRQCLVVKFADPAYPGHPGWKKILHEARADYVVVERDRYGAGPSGFSDLVDQIRADSAHWKEESRVEDPVFVARRIAER